MNYRLLLEQVQKHIQALYQEQKKPALVYHNLSHTEGVVTAAAQIANHFQLNDTDFFVVSAAAWFHDIGYLDQAQDHEEKGAQKAGHFLSGLGVGSTEIEAVKQCILATKMPQSPHNLLEQIVCDADLFHLGTDDFAENNKRMRKEYILLHGTEISKTDWRGKTIELLQKHHYHTDYCHVLLDAKKEENLESLLTKQQKADKSLPVKELNEPKEEVKSSDKNSDKSNRKSNRPERGIETMFRISSGNHQRLSDMADNKSHIMITVNSIIISAIASLLLRKLDNNSYLTIPAIMLLLVSLVTIVLAILATRPHIPNGIFTQAELEE